MLKIYHILTFMLLAVGFVHFMYLLVCMAKRKNKQPALQTIESWPKIEHIICFKNEEKFLEAKIKNCFEIDYPNIHNTFINDNSTDNTLELIKRHVNGISRLINNEKNLGKNQSQIKAVKTSQSDFLLFSDANVFIQPDAVKKMIAAFDEDTGGLTGNVSITTDFEKKEFSGRYWEIEKIIKKFQSEYGCVIGFDGGMYCVRRENYILKRENELSDFETAFLIFEQGRKTRYVEAAKAIEQEKRTIKSAFKSRMRASNRVIWSYYRILKYIRKLSHRVILHFILHKLVRYGFFILFVLCLPFFLYMSIKAPFFLLVLFIPMVFRFIVESIAVFSGGIIAMTGKEYRTWSDKK